MAKIRDAKVRQHSGGYERLFGNEELGRLASRVHSAVISSGTELERMVAELLKKESRVVENADKFLDSDYKDDIYLIPKNVVKKSEQLSVRKEEPDFVVLVVQGKKRHCHIIELKDGDAFDTKKSAAERENLIKFQNYIASKLPFQTFIHVCCFNQSDKNAIVSGLKGEFGIGEVMTGQEFCDLLKIDYASIVARREADQPANFEYFISELLKIAEVRTEIERQLQLKEDKL